MHVQSALLHTLGRSIIEEHYPNLEPLKVAFMFQDEAEIRNGKVIPGRTHRATDRDYALHTYDFVITIAKDSWETLSDEHQYALLDHFIAFMGLRYERAGENWVPIQDPGTGRLRSFIREPDVKDFEVVIERHGAYSAEIRSLFRAFVERRLAEKAAAKKAKKEGAESVLPDLAGEPEGEESEETQDGFETPDGAQGYDSTAGVFV